MNPALRTTVVQEYIIEQEHADTHRLLLSGVPFQEVTAQEIVQQIEGRAICQKKIPSFVQPNILYPPKVNLEQSSSELTARYKQQLIPENCQSIADITGGFGVDLFFTSEGFQQAYYCDTNEELCAIAQNNFAVLNRQVEVFHQDGISWLRNQTVMLDVLLVDPSRRSEQGKVILLENSSPNIIEHQELLLQSTQFLLIKLSPMIDLSYLIERFSTIGSIHIVSVQNDVKELIVFTNRNAGKLIKIVTSDFDSSGQLQQLDFEYNHKSSCQLVIDLESMHFIYEPYKVLLKADVQDTVAEQNHLKKLDQNSNLFFSELLQNPKLFKSFQIIQILPKLDKQLKQDIGGQVNVVCRNFPLKPEQVLKKIGMKQGGEQTLFCSKKGQQSVYVLAKRVTG